MIKWQGLSERRRLPRAGKIKLGVMVTQNGKTYPRATDFFVCPPDVTDALSLPEKPRELPIMFPSDDPEQIFPQTLKMYRRSSGLWCSGDGERAKRWDETGHLAERTCPCEYLDSGECGPVATLNFLLPDVPGIGIFQIDTGNKASITSLNTAFEQFAAMFGGLRGIPFLLKLEPAQTMRWNAEKKQMEKVTVHALRLDSPYSLRQILEWRKALGKPVEALMPAPEMDDDPIEVHAEPDAPETGAASASGPTAEPEEWDASRLFKAAADLGISPTMYEKYLQGQYGARSGDLSDEAVRKERARLEQPGDGSAVRKLVAEMAMVASGGRKGA